MNKETRSSECNRGIYPDGDAFAFGEAPPSVHLRALEVEAISRFQHIALDLVDNQLSFPNGLAFSPDGKTLYVAVSDPARAIWMAYDVDSHGNASNRRVFFDATAAAKAGKKGLPDGLKVDVDGNLFATGPGGVYVFTPGGKHLGTIVTGEPTANCAFGDDGSTLYMTVNHQLMRVRTKTKGLGF